MIELSNVCHSFDGKLVLNHINLHVNRGEFAIVVGEPKSGKSTIFRLLAKRLIPLQGKIYINEMNIYEYDNKEVYDKVVLMPEMFILDEHLTVKMNLEIINKNPLKSYIDCLFKVGLKNILNRQVQMLNGLEKRQVYLASLLTFNPEVLIVDEVSGSLDDARAKVMYNLLEQLNKEGLTILALTKNNNYGRLVKRSYHLDQGRLI